MGKARHLKHIPIDKEFDYATTRNANIDLFKEGEHWAHAKTQAVKWGLEEYVNLIDENGMEKAVLIISAMLYSIDKDEVFEDLVLEFLNDASDLKTGDYDDLFSAEDIKNMYADIERIEKYIKEHQDFRKLI